MFVVLQETEQGIPRAVVSGPHNGTVLITARVDRHGNNNLHGDWPGSSGSMQDGGDPFKSGVPAIMFLKPLISSLSCTSPFVAVLSSRVRLSLLFVPASLKTLFRSKRKYPINSEK